MARKSSCSSLHCQISQYLPKNSRSHSSPGFLPDLPCSCGHSSARRSVPPRTIRNVPASSLEFGKVLVFEMWILRFSSRVPTKKYKNACELITISDKPHSDLRFHVSSLVFPSPSLAHSEFWIESARRPVRPESELPELFSQPLRPVKKVIHSNISC